MVEMGTRATAANKVTALYARGAAVKLMMVET
jgi:hypothetical protein